MSSYNRKTWTRALYPEIIAIKRYSELLELHNSLKTLPISLPKFPPKKLFGNKKEAFIQARVRNLNNYYAELLQNDTIRSHPAMLKLIEPVA